MKTILWLFLLCAGPALSAADARSYLLQANGLYARKNYDQALAAYAASLRLDNRQASAYQGVGNCYLAKGDRDKALKYYRYALQLNPQNAALSSYVAKLGAAVAAGTDPVQQGHQLYKQRRYDDAIQSYQKSLAANPQDANALQGIGNCYFAKGDKANASKFYHQALDAKPGNAALANFLAKFDASAGIAVSEGGGWFQPAWRSAILPGWGQVYNGQTGKGIFLGGLTLGLFAGEIVTYVMGSQAREQYQTASGPSADYDTPYKTWESMATLNHYFAYGMFAAYTYTLLDSIWSAKSPKNTALYQQPQPVQLGFDSHGFKLKAKLLEF